MKTAEKCHCGCHLRSVTLCPFYWAIAAGVFFFFAFSLGLLVHR